MIEIQDSFCLRALREARYLAEQLVDEKGHFKHQILARHAHAEGYSDDAFMLHQEKLINRWQSDPLFSQKFRRFSLPLYHPFAHDVIRWTLGLDSKTILKDFHIKRAALAACLTPLRQSVGSCFATAPAIQIQQSHIDLFIEDLYELLSRGRLRRVVDGVEYTAPFCVCSRKAITDNALLKVWEFTLASYCDIKMEFSKWNLGWCVGLSPQEAGGIGSALLQALEEKLHQNREDIDKKYKDASNARDALHTADTLASRARTEEEMRRLKADLTARAHHFQVCQDIYHELLEKEKIIAEMLKVLIEHYTSQFAIYFQEIYDPEFESKEVSFYEDRRAGFRLIYKHGRSESLLWTAVYNEQQFISVLDNFFKAVEPAIVGLCKEPYAKQLVSEMTTVILLHLQTPDFIKAALTRAKKQDRLPWAYSSGGMVDQIASLYFRKSSPLKSEHRPIQDELDLFTFIIETMKGFPPSITNRFSQDPSQTLLFQSPTHVCLLLPGRPLFQKAWNDSGLTYTWIRDEWIAPAKQFYQEMTLSKDEQRELYRRIGVEGELRSSMSLEEFAGQVKQVPEDVLGSFFFQTLPLISTEKCQALLQQMLKLPPLLSSEEVFQLLPKNSMIEVRDQMQDSRLAPPLFLFADTNWSEGYFSFVIHPITLKLEVWKTDLAGIKGAPLPLVKSWFKSDPWFIFSN